MIKPVTRKVQLCLIGHRADCPYALEDGRVGMVEDNRERVRDRV